MRNIIAGSHTEQSWGCSKSHTEKNYIQIITVCDQKSCDHTAMEANKRGKAHPICSKWCLDNGFIRMFASCSIVGTCSNFYFMYVKFLMNELMLQFHLFCLCMQNWVFNKLQDILISLEELSHCIAMGSSTFAYSLTNKACNQVITFAKSVVTWYSSSIIQIKIIHTMVMTFYMCMSLL